MYVSLQRYNTYGMSKLTLSIDPAVVSRAKRYAKRRGTSVSHIVETYLASVTVPAEPGDLPPVLRRMRGSLKKGDIEDYRNYLSAKYR